MMLDFSYALLKSGALNYVISKFEDYKDDSFYNEVSRVFESYSKQKRYQKQNRTKFKQRKLLMKKTTYLKLK